MTSQGEGGSASASGPGGSVGVTPEASSLAEQLRGTSRLKANAIGLKDAVVVGLASSGPTASIALTLVTIVSAMKYGGPVAILICAVPMFGIALAYRRLNHWRVDCGATYTWAGKAITPYFGFMVGWVMLLGYFLGTISDVLPIGPYVMSVIDPSLANSSWAAAISATAWVLVVTVIAYIGIQLTTRFQWLLATIEYTVITAFAVVALVAVFGHNANSARLSWSWFSWHGFGGGHGLIAGILVAVYMFSGWDSAVYVNEETKQSRRNPGRAVVVSVVMLTFMYTFLTFAYEGAVKKDKLVANGSNSLFYIVKVLAGSGWAKLMVVAVLLSIVGATQTALISGARIAFSMGGDGTLPRFLGRSHPKLETPTRATLLFAGLSLIALWVYIFDASSVQGAFANVTSTVGLMFGLFYAATGISMAVYYRRLAVKSFRGVIELLLVPLVSAGFLLWVTVKAVPGLGGWGGEIMKIAYVLLAIGVVLMIVGRVRHHTDYYDRPLEAYDPTTVETS